MNTPTPPTDAAVNASAATRLGGATRLLGLIADPVAQARSPGMANALLQERGRFGEFALVPMQVDAAGLPALLAALRRLRNFSGAIVSMPHKIAILPLLDGLELEAAEAGAVNVIRRDADGRLTGAMLDGEGFVAGLRAEGYRVKMATCMLAGAGGAASAIAFALARHGCASLCIVNRTLEKAQALADRVAKAYPDVAVSSGLEAGAAFDLAINATSLGMQASDALPIPAGLLPRVALVAECVLAPDTTRLMQAARDQGCRVQGGLPMLAAQMDLMLSYMGAA